MFCAKCGKEIENGEKFCVNCGAAVEEEAAQAASRIQKKKEGKGKGGLIAALAAVIFVLVCVTGSVWYLNSDGYHIRRNMQLAQQCIAEEEYQEALDYYQEALKLDRTMADAYLGAAEACLSMEDYDGALDILKKGLKRVSDSEEESSTLREKLVEAYHSESDAFLTAGDCVSAVQILVEGGQDTESYVLVEQEMYLRKNIVCVRKYWTDDSDGMKREILYDLSGKKTEEIHYTAEGTVLRRTEYQYDESGNLTEEITYAADGTVECRGENKFDEAGNLTEEITYAADGTVECRGENKFDEAGNLIEETQYASDGSIDWQFTNEYDESGNRISTYSQIWWSEYKYDASGNLIEDICHYNDDSTDRWEHTYDESGNQKESIYYTFDGTIGIRTEYKYDLFGNCIQEISRRDAADSDIEYKYEYRYVGE